eukprot:748733-Hanusia_phi.AAC.2
MIGPRADRRDNLAFRVPKFPAGRTAAARRPPSAVGPVPVGSDRHPAITVTASIVNPKARGH